MARRRKRRTWAAYLRERAAEELIGAGKGGEGEAELERAVAFSRSVGATFFVDRRETLLRERRRLDAGQRRYS